MAVQTYSESPDFRRRFPSLLVVIAFAARDDDNDDDTRLFTSDSGLARKQAGEKRLERFADPRIGR